MMLCIVFCVILFACLIFMPACHCISYSVYGRHNDILTQFSTYLPIYFITNNIRDKDNQNDILENDDGDGTYTHLYSF